jgi:putative ABC transport system permease protein
MIPLQYNIRSLFVRKTTTLVTVAGIALVVFVLSAALMLSEGIEKTLGSSGRSDYAIVLRDGSDVELPSSIEIKNVGVVLSAPGVRKGQDGRPLGAGELVVVITQDRLGSEGQVSNVQIRGVANNPYQLRPFVTIVEGRPAKAGTDEVVIGAQLVGRFAGMGLGKTFELKKNRPVAVVGVFEAEGSSFESEVWADVETVRTAFGREGLVSSVTVALESETKFDAFETTVERDKQLGLMALREQDYYEKQSEGTAMFIRIVGWIITVFFILAAVIGAFITMNTAVANRRREIGTMLALGFRGGSVLMSFVLEAILLSLIGAAVGVLAAFFMSFARFSMMNFATWSEIVFRFEMTPGILVTAVVVGTAMGLLGGFVPAFRAARVKPVEAMRG